MWTKEKRQQYNKKWYQEHLDYYKKYHQEHKEKIKQCGKKWTEKNREKRREIGRKYDRTTRKLKRKFKRQTNPRYRLDCNISCIISICLKDKKKWRKWEKLVGYAIEDLMIHLEAQFDDNMNWNNYGSYWWVDHIKPRSLFNYTFPEDPQFKECWALSNLQPLEKIANIKKGNKFSKVVQTDN